MIRKIISAVAVVIILLLLSRVAIFFVVASEGYPTIEAMRNISNRDGQIRFELPEGWSISEIIYEGAGPYSIEITENRAIIKVGYTYAKIELRYRTEDSEGTVEFDHVHKGNNWNRLVFYGESDPNGKLIFRIAENGVSRDPTSYSIAQRTEQASDGNP